LATNWVEKFFEGTRGRMVTLPRCSGRSVEERVRALDLTDNGVRAHLAVLERDGIVRQRGRYARLRVCPSASAATVARGLAAASMWRQPMTLPKDRCACQRQMDLEVKSDYPGMRLVQPRCRKLQCTTNELFNRPGKLSGMPGFDSFRGIPNKESMRVEREHHVQGATRVLFLRHLEGPQDAVGLHE